MSKFLNSLADKANAHLHNLPTLDQLPHSARTARVSLDPRRSEYTKPLQMVLTSQKGVVIDYESVARESKVTSKELFIWGKEQQEDLKDVTDRLAYLTFLCGDLASAHSKSLETSRGSLKELRDAENNLGRERAARDKIRNQMTQLREGKHKDKPESNSKVEEFRKELERLEGEDEGEELEVEKLKRAKLAECFEKQFDSIQEYAEKLLLVAAHGRAFLTSLDSSLAHAPYRRPSKGYSGADNTGSVRSSLESSIKNWTPKPLNIPTTSSPGHPGREGSIASFGDTHGHELNRIPSVDQSNASGGNTPSTTSGQNGGQATHHTSPGNNSVRFDDSKAPQLPPRDPFADPHASNGGKNTAPVPTVAETGVPSTGTGGPASGQIGHPEADEDSVIGDGSEWGSNLDRAPTYKSTYDGPSGDKYPVEETADKGKAPVEAPKKTKEEEAAEDAARAAHEGGDKPAPQYQ